MLPLAAVSEVTSTPTPVGDGSQAVGFFTAWAPFSLTCVPEVCGQGAKRARGVWTPLLRHSHGVSLALGCHCPHWSKCQKPSLFAFLLQSGTLQQSRGLNGASPDPGPMKAPSFCPQVLTGVHTLGRTVEPLHFLAGARSQRVNTSAVSKVICEEY